MIICQRSGARPDRVGSTVTSTATDVPEHALVMTWQSATYRPALATILEGEFACCTNLYKTLIATLASAD